MRAAPGFWESIMMSWSERTLEGGSDEEILEWCFANGRKPGEEEIAIWNAFLAKRGWRDEGNADLMEAKKRAGWENRDDIQTWVDLHDAEEGRKPRRFISAGKSRSGEFRSLALIAKAPSGWRKHDVSRI